MPPQDNAPVNNAERETISFAYPAAKAGLEQRGKVMKIVNTLRGAFCGLCVAGAFSLGPVPSRAADYAIARPDLKITEIAENGTHAWVKVQNAGTANAGACSLRVWHLSNGTWFISTTKGVNALAPGASVWVLLQANGIAASFNYYMIDATNVVSESKESNNGIYIPYGPAG